MQVNQEDYEDKLHEINRLNREVQALRLKVDTIKHQRDTIMECLVEVADVIENYTEYGEDIREAVTRAHKIIGQSETM